MTWEDLKAHKVKVYSTPWCGDCRRLKTILAEHGVDFEEIDIDAKPEAADYLAKRTGHKAIPYAEIDDKVIVKGWHKDKPGRWDDTLFLEEIETGLK